MAQPMFAPIPTPPTEEELRAAYLRQQQDPRPAALMLAGDPGLRAAGAGYMEDQRARGRASREAVGQRFTQAMQVAEERRQQQEMEQRQAYQQRQLGLEGRRLSIAERQLEQSRYVHATNPYTGETVLYDTKTAKFVSPGPTGPGGGPGAPTAPGAQGPRYMKPLTEVQGQAAMFLEQAQSALGAAKELGGDILPTPGMGGLYEGGAWMARNAGFPQLSSDAMLQRQSLLLSIAEPVVRAESGAAVPPDEVRRLAVRYVPMPGETRHEQLRKIRSLVRAVGAQMQKLPPLKAQEFIPLQNELVDWADALEAPEAGAAPAGPNTNELLQRYGPPAAPAPTPAAPAGPRLQPSHGAPPAQTPAPGQAVPTADELLRIYGVAQ